MTKPPNLISNADKLSFSKIYGYYGDICKSIPVSALLQIEI